MNKDEMKMIEQIRKDFVARCLKGSDGCDLRDCQHCHAESLYNAGYRKVADDEIVLEQKRLKEIVIAKIEHLADIEIRKDSTCEKYFDMVLDLLDKELEDNNEQRRND